MNTVTLPAICDRAAARALHTEFCEGIGPEKLGVDASAVERIGVAMLRLLVSAATTESGVSLRAPSEPFMKSVRLAGLEDILGCEIEEASAA